jgi:hypothetical protein
MSINKAKEFVEYLKTNPDVAEKMSGFTLDELKNAIEDHIKKDPSLNNWDDFVSTVGDGY